MLWLLTKSNAIPQENGRKVMGMWEIKNDGYYKVIAIRLEINWQSSMSSVANQINILQSTLVSS